MNLNRNWTATFNHFINKTLHKFLFMNRLRNEGQLSLIALIEPWGMFKVSKILLIFLGDLESDWWYNWKSFKDFTKCYMYLSLFVCGICQPHRFPLTDRCRPVSRALWRVCLSLKMRLDAENFQHGRSHGGLCMKLHNCHLKAKLWSIRSVYNCYRRWTDTMDETPDDYTREFYAEGRTRDTC